VPSRRGRNDPEPSLAPNGATFNSQGRKPLESQTRKSQSPVRATRSASKRAFRQRGAHPNRRIPAPEAGYKKPFFPCRQIAPRVYAGVATPPTLVPSPNGAAFDSQGRKPLESNATRNQSPVRATQFNRERTQTPSLSPRITQRTFTLATSSQGRSRPFLPCRQIAPCVHAGVATTPRIPPQPGSTGLLSLGLRRTFSLDAIRQVEYGSDGR
jgi:hypothetical protein